MKKLSFAVYQTITSSTTPLTDTRIANAAAILDLAPGESVKNGQLNKAACYIVTIGEVGSRNGCLVYRSNSIEKNLTTNGEIVLGDYCTSKLRVNFTHTISANSDGTIYLAPDTFINLYEEEGILDYPPKVVDSTNMLMDIIKNSTLLNRIDEPRTTNVTTSTATTSLSLMAGILGSSFIQFLQLLIIVCFVAALILLIVFLARIFIKKQQTRTLLDTTSTEEKQRARGNTSELEVKF